MTWESSWIEWIKLEKSLTNSSKSSKIYIKVFINE
jgi:hypothetical protein